MSVDAKAGYKCPTCAGAGSMSSSDDSWWDCRVCGGTGRLADRRRPRDPLVEAAREARDAMRNMAIYPMTVQPHLLRDLAAKLGAALGERER